MIRNTMFSITGDQRLQSVGVITRPRADPSIHVCGAHRHRQPEGGERERRNQCRSVGVLNGAGREAAARSDWKMHFFVHHAAPVVGRGGERCASALGIRFEGKFTSCVLRRRDATFISDAPSEWGEQGERGGGEGRALANVRSQTEKGVHQVCVS
jgi:hypothetical protein